jgi:sec-independent protein translocase protein TatA
MFGIGGGELVLYFYCANAFGSDKVPEMARAMGKAMAQLKHATNDIKVKFKRVEANGLDSKSLSDLTGSFNTQVDKVKIL